MRRTNVIGWLLVLPAAVLLGTFTHYPTIATLWTSFFSTPKKNRPGVWVGLDNYQAMMADPSSGRTMAALGIVDTVLAIGLPYMASAFGIFLLRQTFKAVPKELDDAARVEGAGPLETLWKVYVPLAKPVYVAYALVSISYHWNNFLWPLIVTNSVTSRPLTVGLQVFSSTDQGVGWSVITAATLLTSGPLLIGFLLFQRQFVQGFMRAGIR